jgi:hypothetical protein
VQWSINHSIYSNGKYIPAGQLNIGDEIITYNYSFSKSVIHLINSGLLGDGSISKNANNHKYTEF